MSRVRTVVVLVASVLVGTSLGPVPAISASSVKVAYATAVNVPEHENQTLAEFVCQLCDTPTGGKVQADYLATIDIDEASRTFGQVIARNDMQGVNPEIHHMGIDAHSSRVIAYDLYQDEAIVFDVGTNPRSPAFLKKVDLAEESRRLLGVVPGLPQAVGYGMPHVSYRLPNGNFLVAMTSAYVPELPELHEGAPGGFIELTPDGDVVSAFPKLSYVNNQLTNGQYEGKGIFSLDYDKRLKMMVHADLMTARSFKCGIGLRAQEFGRQVVLWDFNAAAPSTSTVFQTIDMPVPFTTAPAIVPRSVHGMDVIYLTTFTDGVWALHRPTGSGQRFQAVQVFPLSAPHGLAHLRLHPSKSVMYLSDPTGDGILVLDFGADPLRPTLLQQVDVPQMHMMKFDVAGQNLYISNGLNSILDFQLREQPFNIEYRLSKAAVRRDGTLAPLTTVFDADAQDGPRYFIGDFFLRENPQPFV